MGTLRETLLTDARRPQLLADCQGVLDAEVAAKGGLSGMALKGAYRTVQKIKPGFVRGVMNLLLDEWVTDLEDTYQAWQADDGGGTYGSYLLARRDEVAERLLSVTDRRAAGTKHRTAGKLYKKLRPGAKAQVKESLPRACTVLDKHLAE